MGERAGTIVDLFCGCGGFSLGAELAGFRSLVAVDVDPVLQSAYRRNFPSRRIVEADISEIDAGAWRQFLGDARPDGVIGGPPCQGFSFIGKRKKNDPRNGLLNEFYRHVEILAPKFFIMENVEGLLHDSSAEILKTAIARVAGRYRILGPLNVNAADFGAATSRRRVVVIGYDPNDVDPLALDAMLPKTADDLVTVREAIADLPSPIPEVKGQYVWAKYPSGPKRGLSDYAIRMRRMPPDGLGWKEAIDRHAAGYVSGAVATRHSREIARRYAVVAGGKTDNTTKSVRLEWDGQCPTLRAGTGPNDGAFQAVRPLHPGKSRVITVREAARLQGFPDWFVFHPTKWHSFRMIGNSVSPLVAHGLFKVIARRLHLSLAR